MSLQGPILTEPSTPSGPGSSENVYGDLIVMQGEEILNPQGYSYTVVSLLGHGQFGQVFQVIEQNPISMLKQTFAMKISKLHPAYIYQSQFEASVLDDVCIISLFNSFYIISNIILENLMNMYFFEKNYSPSFIKFIALYRYCPTCNAFLPKR